MIQEAFVNIECTLKGTQDLSGAGITSMIIGQVQHISVEEEYAHGYETVSYTHLTTASWAMRSPGATV